MAQRRSLWRTREGLALMSVPLTSICRTENQEFYTEWTESFDSFDAMGLHENLLRGIFAYGESPGRSMAHSGSGSMSLRNAVRARRAHWTPGAGDADLEPARGERARVGTGAMPVRAGGRPTRGVRRRA